MRSRLLLILILASVSLAQQGNIRPDLDGPTQIVTRVVRDPRDELLFKFSEARGRFADDIERFRAGLTVQKNREKAAKFIEQRVDVFLKYLRVASSNHPVFDPGELKNLSQDQLAAETLALAQSIRPAIRRVVRTEKNSVVPVSYWDFLYKLEADLLKLKWLCLKTT